MNTMREMVKLARVNCIEPTQTTIGRQIGRQLLPDFEPDPEQFRIVYDNSGVSMFIEDQDAVAKRSGELYQDGVAKRNEARTMVGLDPVPDGDTFSDGKSRSRPPDVPSSNGDGSEGEGEGDETPSNRWEQWAEALIERNDGGTP